MRSNPSYVRADRSSDLPPRSPTSIPSTLHAAEVLHGNVLRFDRRASKPCHKAFGGATTRSSDHGCPAARALWKQVLDFRQSWHAGAGTPPRPRLDGLSRWAYTAAPNLSTGCTHVSHGRDRIGGRMGLIPLGDASRRPVRMPVVT